MAGSLFASIGPVVLGSYVTLKKAHLKECMQKTAVAGLGAVVVFGTVGALIQYPYLITDLLEWNGPRKNLRVALAACLLTHGGFLLALALSYLLTGSRIFELCQGLHGVDRATGQPKKHASADADERASATPLAVEMDRAAEEEEEGGEGRASAGLRARAETSGQDELRASAAPTSSAAHLEKQQRQHTPNLAAKRRSGFFTLTPAQAKTIPFEASMQNAGISLALVLATFPAASVGDAIIGPCYYMVAQFLLFVHALWLKKWADDEQQFASPSQALGLTVSSAEAGQAAGTDWDPQHGGEGKHKARHTRQHSLNPQYDDKL